MFGYVAEPEVVTSHCRVMTPVECCNVRNAKASGDEASGFAVIEQDPLEALSREWPPALKTLSNIRGDSARIVPILHDDPGDMGWARECVYGNRLLDEPAHMAGAETVVFGNATWVIGELHRLVSEEHAWRAATPGPREGPTRMAALSSRTSISAATLSHRSPASWTRYCRSQLAHVQIGRCTGRVWPAV